MGKLMLLAIHIINLFMTGKSHGDLLFKNDEQSGKKFHGQIIPHEKVPAIMHLHWGILFYFLPTP
jgi:hypothetical protein